MSPGNGFRPSRAKGDDGGRHRRRRKVNRVFMSWRFDRPDCLDLESDRGCRASGPDGRYFPPPDVTPLIVVLQLTCGARAFFFMFSHLFFCFMPWRVAPKGPSARLRTPNRWCLYLFLQGLIQMFLFLHSHARCCFGSTLRCPSNSVGAHSWHVATLRCCFVPIRYSRTRAIPLS